MKKKLLLISVFLASAVSAAGLFFYTRYDSPLHHAGTFWTITNDTPPGQVAPVKVDTSSHTPAFSLVGKISPFSRGMLVERYGATVSTRGPAPASAQEMKIFPYRDVTVIALSNFRFPQRRVASLALALDPTAGDLLASMGIVFKNGNVWRFDSPRHAITEKFIGDAMSIPKKKTALFAEAENISALSAAQEGRYVVPFIEDISLSDVAQVFAVFDTDKLNDIEYLQHNLQLKEWAFQTKESVSACKDAKAYTLTGKISPARNDIDEVYLVSEKGSRTASKNTPDGYTFENVACDAALKLVAVDAKDNIELYSEEGRWFWPGEAQSVNIDAEPRYKNSGKFNPKKSLENYAPVKSARTDYRIGPGQTHVLQKNTGYDDRIQYWDDETFTNLYGFWDQDRFAENKNGCYRVLLTGGSNVTSIHVSTGLKFNTIAEETLSMLLGSCVEIATAGQGAGSLGDYYALVAAYAPIFKPDLILVDTSSVQMMPLLDEYAFKMSGATRKHSQYAYFERQKDGGLIWREKDKNYSSNHGEADAKPFIGCVPFNQSAEAAPYLWPQSMRDLWTLYADALSLMEENTGTHVGLLGIAPATIGARTEDLGEHVCVDKKTPFLYGEGQLIRNMKKLCKTENRPCIITPIPLIDEATEELWLTWPNDMHMHWRGHQYIARELARALFLHLSDQDMESAVRRYLDLRTPPVPEKMPVVAGDKDKNKHLLNWKKMRSYLEALREMTPTMRLAFLDPVEKAYFKNYDVFLERLTTKNHVPCSPEQKGGACPPASGKSLSLRYDNHIGDIPFAIILSGLHDKHKLPVTHYDMSLNTPEYKKFVRYYEMLAEHASPYNFHAPHPSPVCSCLDLVMDGSDEIKACNDEKFQKSVISELTSEQGDAYYASLQNCVTKSWELSLNLHKNVFGPSKTVAQHGWPFNGYIGKEMSAFPDLAKKYKLADEPAFIKTMHEDHGVHDHNMLFTDTHSDRAYVYEGQAADIESRINDYTSRYDHVGVLIHPASIYKQRIVFEEGKAE